MCGHRASDDATLQNLGESNYHGKLRSIDQQDSKPFAGRRFAIIKETLGENRVPVRELVVLANFTRALNRHGCHQLCWSCRAWCRQTGLRAYN